jgi:hypothetical protein
MQEFNKGRDNTYTLADSSAMSQPIAILTFLLEAAEWIHHGGVAFG